MSLEEPDLTFTLQNLPDIHPYNSAIFNATIFENCIIVARTWIKNCKERIQKILSEGKQVDETNVQWANHLKVVRNELKIHQRVHQLLFDAMYVESYDLNGFASSSSSDADANDE